MGTDPDDCARLHRARRKLEIEIQHVCFLLGPLASSGGGLELGLGPERTFLSSSVPSATSIVLLCDIGG